MEYVYGAMILHQLGKPVNEGNLRKVLEAAGAKVDEAKIKAVVSSLEKVNIDEAIKEASMAQLASVQQVAEKKESKKEEKKAEEEKKTEEIAAAGLSSLFG